MSIIPAMQQEPGKRVGGGHSGAGWRAAAVLAVLVAVLAGAGMYFGGTRTRGAYDQINYHERAIRTFAEQMPAVDLRDYMSATTPGYHLVVAAVSRVINGRDHAAEATYTGPNAPALIATQRGSLQVIGLGFTLIWAGVMGWWAGRCVGNALWGVVIALPLFVSVYVMQSAVWLLPDNAAWCCVALMMLLALQRPTLAMLLSMSAVLFVAVWMRQIHLWTAGLVVATAWLGATLNDSPAARRDDALPLHPNDLIPRDTRRWGVAMMLSVAMVVPAIAVVAFFYRLWGGHLVPPSFVQWHNSGRIQSATAAFLLVLVAVFSVPFVGFLWGPCRRAIREHSGVLIVAACVGLALSLIGPSSTTDSIGGRFGALWSISARFPVFAERSTFICIGATAGAVCVAIWLLQIPRRARWIMLAAIAGFALAQSFNPQLWQRYHEPFALLWITIALGSAIAHGSIKADRFWPLAGPLLLSAAFVWLGVSAIRSSADADDDGNRLGHIIAPGVTLPKGDPVKPGAN